MLTVFTLGELLISFGKILLLYILAYINSGLANEDQKNRFFGVSIAYKTQVFQKPNFKSKVVEHLDKGEKIKVHLKHFDEARIQDKEGDQEIDQYERKEGFYQIITKLGRIGFVEKRHIHLIYSDFRDQHFHFNLNKNEDLTDYRLAEPLVKNFPLTKKSSYRLNIQARLGPSFVDNYLFPALIRQERFSNRYGGAITFLKNARFDFEDRFYFGAAIKFLTFRNKFILVNDAEYLEKHLGITLGPIIQYESLRFRNITISHGLEINLIYRRVIIDLEAGLDTEKRKFDGYMVEPTLINQISFQNKKKSIDFNLGMRVSARPKYELKSSKGSILERYWTNNRNDGTYELEAKVYQTYFVGIQVYY